MLYHAISPASALTSQLDLSFGFVSARLAYCGVMHVIAQKVLFGWLVFVFETGSGVAQAGLELGLLPPKCWDYCSL